MDEKNGGFSFGFGNAPEKGDKSAAEEPFEIEAIEVDGEPVSRSEARRLGIGTKLLGEDRPSGRYTAGREPPSKDKTSIVARAALRDKAIAEALDHLENNEIEEALTLAQEMVWRHPDSIPPKIIIARCFINRKEYDKALAILSAIPDGEKKAEIWYFMGLSQSRLGKVAEAMEALRKARNLAETPTSAKRASDLLATLVNEKTTCPVCGKSVPASALVYAGDRLVCSDCADAEQTASGRFAPRKGAEGDDEDEYEDEATEDGGTRRRKRLRPPRSKAELLLRFLFLLCILFILGYFLYTVFPGYYNAARSFLPRDWTFIPFADAGSTAPPAGPAANAGVPRIIPTMTIASAPLGVVVVGQQTSRRVFVEGKTGPGGYFVDIVPKPAGPYAMQGAEGLFTWTPAEEDAGKEFTVTFYGLFNKTMRTPDQVNKVKVSSGLAARKVGDWQAPAPGDAFFALSGPFGAESKPMLAFVHGQYWTGGVTVLSRNAEGDYETVARADLNGRPAGAGLIDAGGEPWLAVADYWNSRIRFYALRNEALSEMSVSIELPGRPVLAAFDYASGVVAALCRTHTGLRVAAYRQESQLLSKEIGGWDVPDEQIWRSLLLLPAAKGADAAAVRLLLLGSVFGGNLLLQPGTDPKPFESESAGVTLVDALYDQGTNQIAYLAKDGFNYVASARSPDRSGETAAEGMFNAGPTPFLSGFALVNFTGAGSGSYLLLGADKAVMRFVGTQADNEPMTVELQSPPRIFGRIAVVRGEGGGDRAVFVDASGGIWEISL